MSHKKEMCHKRPRHSFHDSCGKWSCTAEFLISRIPERNLVLQSGAVLRAAIADDSVPVLLGLICEIFSCSTSRRSQQQGYFFLTFALHEAFKQFLATTRFVSFTVLLLKEVRVGFWNNNYGFCCRTQLMSLLAGQAKLKWKGSQWRTTTR